jgi:MFS family permease
MGQLDASITQLVLPALEREFSASVGEVSWVAAIFLLAVSVMLPIFGRLADMYGRKKLCVAGFLAFIGGSALCGFSPGIGSLISARILQAVGAAMLSANKRCDHRIRCRRQASRQGARNSSRCAGNWSLRRSDVGGWIVAGAGSLTRTSTRSLSGRPRTARNKSERHRRRHIANPNVRRLHRRDFYPSWPLLAQQKVEFGPSRRCQESAGWSYF